MKCAAGKKFVPFNFKNGNAAKCEPCASGTFNTDDGRSTECAIHNPCVDTTVKVAGTPSKDAVCNPGVFSRTTLTHIHVQCTF